MVWVLAHKNLVKKESSEKCSVQYDNQGGVPRSSDREMIKPHGVRVARSGGQAEPLQLSSSRKKRKAGRIV